MNYIIRRMREEDIPQVVEIEKTAFSRPWSSLTTLIQMKSNMMATTVGSILTELILTPSQTP